MRWLRNRRTGNVWEVDEERAATLLEEIDPMLRGPLYEEVEREGPPLDEDPKPPRRRLSA